MIRELIGVKIAQTQRFTEDGKRLPVTLVKAGSCPVVQIKTKEKDGYFALQLGFGERKPKHTSKSISGHIRGANLEKAPRFLREIRLEEQEANSLGQVKVGDAIKASDVFQAGDKVQVVGISKGKGYAGVVKRWHFAGGPRTHGQSDRERAPGSIGSTTTPGRVYKGKKMSGRMGNKRVTIKNLKVLEVKPEENILVLVGLVPGLRGSLLMIRKQ